MKQIILGTAGHIDHGKTSLIRALTGIDTDRLKEEKLRGITIELGFAWLDLPSGQRVGIVDVPGHEKFVKNMVAGATGIDLVALIIAADESVMPQTREHLEICSLLGVKDGMVVLTKTDMVDEEWLELVADDVKSFLQGSFLEDAPIVRVSSTKGQGLSECVSVLDRLCEKVPERASSGLFRLPVDRVFTMKGFGTVITGSLVSGKVRVGDTIMLYPSHIQSKVRGIQVHNQSVDEAMAGMRTAINFQGLERTATKRGDVLGGVDTLKPSYMVDVVLEYLSSNKKPLKNRTRVRFHTGTSEVLGNVVLLDREELDMGGKAVAQLRLESPVSVVRDDPFVIRSYSPIRTIGGGRIINPIPNKHKRLKEAIVAGLKGLVDSSPKESIMHHIRGGGLQGVSFSDLIIMTNTGEKALEQSLQDLVGRQAVVQVDKENRIFVDSAIFDALQDEILQLLEGYHKAHPLKAGITKEVVKSKLPRALGPRAFNLLVQKLAKSGKVVQEKELVRLSGHRIALQADQKHVREKIEQAYLQSGLAPPYVRELVASFGGNAKGVEDVLSHMLEEGLVVKVKEGLYFHKDVIEELKNRLVAFLRAHREITTPQLKEVTGVTRKYMIPLIEYFDTTKVTIRVGDVRRLREG
ncbi:MAG: selenocysteine-specific translation elongation factor [Thermodesulfobacteriota bacterium]|nr:selenocysteine-specific translation elongation factor [Thermodesulfobacteriota bacterium]